MGTPPKHPKDSRVIACLTAATGRKWHKDPYGSFEAFASSSEADVIAAHLKHTAIKSGAAQESDFEVDGVLNHAPVSAGPVGARCDDGVYIKDELAYNPDFLAKIESLSFKHNLDNALERDREIQGEKKQTALDRLNESTGYAWELRQHDADIYYIETINDQDTTAALYKVLERIQKQVLGEDPLAEELRKGAEAHGVVFHVDDDRKITGYSLPPDAENPEPRYCLTVPHQLIEHTEFIEKLPEDLSFQIAEALRQVKGKERLRSN